MEPVPDTQLIQLRVEDNYAEQAILQADTIADIFMSQIQIMMEENGSGRS